MTYLEQCPKCGGPTWNNEGDKSKPGGAWKCKDRDCKDREGYQYNEWSYNKDKRDGVYGGPSGGAGSGDTSGPAVTPAGRDSLEPPDDLPFAPQSRIDTWYQCVDCITQLEHKLGRHIPEPEFWLNVRTELIAHDRRSGRY